MNTMNTMHTPVQLFPPIDPSSPSQQALGKVQKSFSTVLESFQDARHNEDLFVKALRFLRTGRCALYDIQLTYEKHFHYKVETLAFRTYGNCLMKINTFFDQLDPSKCETIEVYT